MKAREPVAGVMYAKLFFFFITLKPRVE